ncbi:MAG: hypothetical protein KAI25_11575 [Hyphomicrobiaceae bacterium]|nr:hypothetical protein [Hyphomicrobiaceae bacterium]
MLAIHRVPLLDRRKSKTTAERLADTRHAASLIKGIGARGDLVGEHHQEVRLVPSPFFQFQHVCITAGMKEQGKAQPPLWQGLRI